MSIGASIRRIFGPYERQVSDAYRSIYFNIDSMVDKIHEWKPTARNILEVGCGEGAVTERLNAAYPGAEITGIDLTPRVGRLYAGSRDRIRFMKCAAQEIAAAEPGRYDLVVLCDVMHHVPVEFRQALLDSIRATLAPGGVFIFKDWDRNFSPIHALCYASDRWITGDHIQYMTRDEMRVLLARSFGEAALGAEARLAPWRNNIATLVQP